jgi:SET domain-containing protein
MTSTMGYGLFACEEIPKDTYIIRYTGKQKKTFDAHDCSYVAKVTYKNKKNEDVTFYIHAKKTKSVAKYANHSCVPNAVFSKIIVSETKKNFLMIKSITDISNGDEILTNYGDEYELMLRDVGGCKCTRCINLKPSAR